MSQYTYGTVKSIGSRENRRTITKNLYGILREFDEEGVDIIYSEGFFGEAIDAAIMNRLLKAAGHKRIPASEILKLRHTARLSLSARMTTAAARWQSGCSRDRHFSRSMILSPGA